MFWAQVKLFRRIIVMLAHELVSASPQLIESFLETFLMSSLQVYTERMHRRFRMMFDG